MKNLGIIIGVLLIALLITGAIYYFFFSETAQKKKLVDQIMEKGKSIPRFDGSPVELMKLSIPELKQRLIDVTGLAKQ